MERRNLRVIGLVREFTNRKLWSGDQLVFAALNRVNALVEGFDTLWGAGNYLAAAPLVRLQLDNGLRTFGLMMTNEPHATAKRMLAGARLDTLNDRRGKRLTDSHIASELDGLRPGVRNVYNLFSGHVHLSQEAFRRTWDVPDSSGAAAVQFSVGDPSGFVETEEWLNLKSAFEFATEVALDVIRIWAETSKSLPPDGLAPPPA
jgi:hypothetical protein